MSTSAVPTRSFNPPRGGSGGSPACPVAFHGLAAFFIFKGIVRVRESQTGAAEPAASA
jgi:hypothetical protein